MPLVGSFRPFRSLRLSVEQGVARTDAERLAHLAMVQALYTDGRHPAHEMLYRDLSILDAKAASLLTYNSIILAAISIFVATSESLWLQAGFALTLVVAALSCFSCLRVIWIHWSAPDSLERPESFWLDLLVVRDRRTLRYRRAWLLSALALSLVALGAVLTVFD